MTRSTAWPWGLLVPCVVLAFASCGTPPATEGPDDGATDGDGTTGGATASGGANSAGGQQGSGGSEVSSGGNVSASGGRGGLMTNECTDAYGCGEGATCYAPGVAPPAICGAPQWCGACSCPAMLPVPEGHGLSCDESTPCPSVSDTVLRAASVCDPETSLCTECLSDADCSGNLPYCAAGTCFQCKADTDCPEQVPFCNAAFGLDICRECKTTADCSTGLCSIDGMCLPGCQSDAQCGPNSVCGAEERCVPQPCQADTECSVQSTCSDQTCRARTCESDAACPGGHCVSGSCYEMPGTCHYDTAG